MASPIRAQNYPAGRATNTRTRGLVSFEQNQQNLAENGDSMGVEAGWR
jgi:hypothetical protein